MKNIIKHIKNNKYNFTNIIIKFSIICVLLSVIYLLYNKINRINESFATTSLTTTQHPTNIQSPTTTSNLPTTPIKLLMDKGETNIKNIIKDIKNIVKSSTKIK